jgi:molybdate-binding protein
VYIASTHLLDELTGKADFLPITKMFPRNSVTAVSYAMWRKGLIVVLGNPKKIAAVRNLLHKDVRFTNREPGSGCRRLLDNLLARHDIPHSKVRGYDQVTVKHLPAVRRIQAGEVDCCIGLQSGARSLELGFIELIRKPYNLVLRRKQLDLPPCSGAAGNAAPGLLPARDGSLYRLRHAHGRGSHRLKFRIKSLIQDAELFENSHSTPCGQHCAGRI